DEPGHRIWRRRIHPDLAVPVDGHEPERRVDGLVRDGDLEPVPVADRTPVGHGRTTHRVDTDPQPRRPDGLHVDDRREVVDVLPEEVVAPGPRSHLVISGAPDAVDAVRPTGLEDPIRLVLD